MESVGGTAADMENVSIVMTASSMSSMMCILTSTHWRESTSRWQAFPGVSRTEVSGAENFDTTIIGGT